MILIQLTNFVEIRELKYRSRYTLCVRSPSMETLSLMEETAVTIMEAALRNAHYIVTGMNPEPDSFKEVRSTGEHKKEGF